MGEATAKEESGAAAPEQSDAIVGAAGRLEEACRDLTACLRALPGVAERRAAALLLRAAAVSGRLHLKDAIRLLDAAFESDQDGPLCGEQRVVPETPERSPPAGPADDQSPRVKGATLTSDGEDAGAQNGVADGPAASDDQQDSDASQEVGQTRSKKKKKGKSADSDDSAKASVDKSRLKKKKDDSSDSDAAAKPSAGQAKSKKKKKKGTSSDSDESTKAPAKRTKKRRGDGSDEEEEASAGDDSVPPANSSESQGESGPGLLIANVEPLQEPMDSQEAIVKTEPEVESKEESEPVEDPVDEPDSRLAMSDSDSPAGDNSAMEESEAESAEASPKFQNERDRMALLLSSDGEDGDDPGLDRDGSDARGEDALADGDQQDSETTVIRSGDEKKRASEASSSDDTSRAGRRLRKRAVKEEPASNESASDGGKGKRRGRHRRQAKKSANSDSDRDVSKILGRRGRDRRERQASESSGDASSDSGPETAQRRERQRVHRRRRRPRGPPEPTADCSVVLRRLPKEIEQEAEENGFVKITKRAKKRLSEETLEIRRLANVAVLLRTSMLKEEGSSDDSDDSDTEKEAEQKKAKKVALRTAKKAEKKKKKTLKDMSDGDSDGRPSGVESDDSNKPSTSALVPMEQNDFDRQQLLASDSASDDDSPAVKDDSDSDFELSDKDKKRLKKKAEKAAKKKSGCEEGKDTDNDDDDDKGKKKGKGKKDSRAKDSSDESNSKETKVKKESDDKDEPESDEDGETEEAKGSKKDKDKKKKKGDEKDEAEEGMDVDDDDDKKSGANASGSEAGDSKDEKQKSKKMSAKVRKLLNGKMSATDSSEEDEKMKEKILKKRAKEDEKEKDKAGSEKSGDDEDDGPSDGLPQLVDLPSTDEEEVVEKKRSPKKRRMRVVDDSDSDLMLLDSDAADEEEEDAEPSRKRSRSSSSSSISSASDSADDFRPPKKTRSRARLKRIRRMSDDSADSSGDDSVEEVKPDSQGTPGKGGRKNIRHIREAEQSTKEASQAELERRKRIEDKQAMYNELFKRNASSDEPAALDKLVLDFDPDTKKPLVTVHKNFVKILKPHQVDGVKFMFDSCIESVKRLDDETNMDNAGCILAHCMGLGKTLQVVVLLHTLMDSKATRGEISCALVVCPKNTVQNWVRELKTWQKKCRVPEVDVVDITFRKDNYERSFELEQWKTEGGVCVLSYDMFKRFCGAGGKKGYVKKQKDRFQSALLDPGPDIVVCDEGHLLKNPRTAAFKSLNQMKCRRRVILTGTPLQNNLREYHTMVEFVKPRLLGSESEFSNRFIRPIENGSAVDAQSRDVRLMKRRSHVLHKLLNSVVQRRDYNVLMPFLPPKLEFTLMVKLSELQRKLYESYLEKARSRTTRKVLADFQALSRVWTHPRSIQMKDEQDDVKDEMKSEREAMERFVADSSTSEEEDSKDGSGNGAEAAEGAAPNGEAADDSEWWRSCIPDDMQFEDISLSGKLSLLDQLLVKCENIGDKLLVFSQSLFSLNLIEEHLERLHKEMARCRSSDKKHPSHVYFGTWKPDYDYFRLDGSTSEERRQLMCDRINKASNERARLMLISTKAGGLGINLVGANRVVIFDASWNPTADSQAIFRVYRFGQVKPSYVYRFIAQGCMEEKIYDRQISKLSLSCRVVDEQQVERHFSQHDVEELYDFDPERKRTTGLIVPKDDLVLMELVSEQAAWVSSVHGHDSLLQNVADEELNADEQRAAWEEYENDRRGIPNVGDIIPLVEGKAIDKATVIEMIKKDNPTATDNEVLLMIPKAIQTLRAYYFKKQQQEQRAREEQYRQTLELQRQSMYSQHAMQQDARNTNMDPAAYSRLLEMVAAQHAAGASAAAASGGAAGGSAAHSLNRQTVDRQAYAKLLELMAAHSRPPAAHSGRAPAAVPAVHGNRTVTPAAHSRAPAVPAGQSIGRQRTAHVPGPSHRHHQRVAAAIQRSMGGGGGAGSAGGPSSGATGTSAGAVALPKSITVLPVNKKPGEDGGKSDKPVKPPDVVDIT